ncbi:MAG TPA: hypothetical protein VFO77_04760 [Actinoplanes sp.]|nr:hypothetical protein [Actinoplanes sp.]
MEPVGALRVSLDVGPAQWLAADALVPPGFDAYARLLHPAVRWVDDSEVPVGWAQIAAADGTGPIGPATSWESVAGDWAPDGHPGLWDDEPGEGQPAFAQAVRLAALLAAHTTDQERCWYAVWDGYGSLALPRSGVPRVALAGRSMLLLAGPLSAATTSLERSPFDRRANLWWPADHAWFVATDVTATSTMIAGSRSLIDALLADEALETVPI